MATSWDSAGRTLQELALRFRELGAAPLVEWASLPIKERVAAIRAAETCQREACDGIIRSLLSDRGAVQPTAVQAYLCSMRCFCGLDTLGILHAPGSRGALYSQPPLKWSDQELMEWLLIANWHQRHETWLNLAALAQSGVGLYSG